MYIKNRKEKYCDIKLFCLRDIYIISTSSPCVLAKNEILQALFLVTFL